MRAAVIRQYGPPENIEILDVPTPQPGPRQVRIAVAAAGLNPVDAATRAGFFRDIGLIPATQAQVGLGWDVAGSIAAVGEGITDFAVGDRVVGLRDNLLAEVGAYADQLVLDAAAVASIPDSLDLVAAGSLPLNTLTADQALELTGLRAGQSLLVTGAAGAVGGTAVQLAARAGIDVIAVACVADEAAVQGFGAAEFIPRTDHLDLRSSRPAGVDAVIDAAVVGGEAIAAVRTGGVYVALRPLGPVDVDRAVELREVHVRPDGNRLAELAVLAATGALTVRVAETFPLGEAEAAHRLLDEGGLRGRILLTT